MTVRGWEKLEDKTSPVFTLKWVELKQHIDFKSFREGQKLAPLTSSPHTQCDISPSLFFPLSVFLPLPSSLPSSLPPGEQIVNHFPNINLLTTKIGLLESLRAHDRLIAHRYIDTVLSLACTH